MKSSGSSLSEAQKRRQEEAEAARAFAEYVETFQDSAGAKASSKTWIKAGVYESGKKRTGKLATFFK